MRTVSVCATALMLSACELPSEIRDVFEDKSATDQTASDAENPKGGSDAAAQVDQQAGTAADRPTRDLIRSVQERLAQLGYSPGPVDGLDGPKTRSAVRSYQSDMGFPKDGAIDQALLDSLTKASHGKAELPGASSSARKKMPVYAAGDTFVYSDGKVETVVGIEGDEVRWQDGDGAKFTAYRNFILPALDPRTDLLNEQATMDVDPGALWPLAAGRETSFTAQTEMIRKGQRESQSKLTSYWRCRVGASKPITVAAGTFEAVRVVCQSTASSAQIPSERVWYYAPRIRHFVRRDDMFRAEGREESVELVAIHLTGKDWPPAARTGLGWALQQTLETKAEKQSIDWGSSGVDVKVSIKPTAALSGEAAPYCRTFEQTVRHAGGTRIYPGKACRNASGQWLIPGLDGVTQAAKKGS